MLILIYKYKTIFLQLILLLYRERVKIDEKSIKLIKPITLYINQRNYLRIKNKTMLSAIQTEIRVLKRNYNSLYAESRQAIAKHSSYHVRKQYYPHNLNEWESIEKEMANDFKERLLLIKKSIRDLENKEKQAEIEEDAANGLLLLKKRAVRKETRENNKMRQQKVVPRRSARIASKKV